MKSLLALCLFLLLGSHAYSRLLPPIEMPSKALGGNRTIRIYLPPSYDAETNRHYPVIYLHDGQNVFSSAGTNCCFGWGAWDLDVTAERLAREHAMQEVIMVGVDSGMRRMEEMSGHGVQSDNYAEFLIHELKPRIDSEYRTLKSPENTAVMGSSMGGLSSLTLGWQHPEVFGKVASLSAALQIEDQYFAKKVVAAYTGKPVALKIYLYCGTVDFTGGDDNHSLDLFLAKELRRIGWKPDNFKFYEDTKPLTDPADLERSCLRRDKWAEAKTSQHNEFYWRMHAGDAFRFLFPE